MRETATIINLKPGPRFHRLTKLGLQGFRLQQIQPQLQKQKSPGLPWPGDVSCTVALMRASRRGEADGSEQHSYPTRANYYFKNSAPSEHSFFQSIRETLIKKDHALGHKIGSHEFPQI